MKPHNQSLRAGLRRRMMTTLRSDQRVDGDRLMPGVNVYMISKYKGSHFSVLHNNCIEIGQGLVLKLYSLLCILNVICTR